MDYNAYELNLEILREIFSVDSIFDNKWFFFTYDLHLSDRTFYEQIFFQFVVVHSAKVVGIHYHMDK